MARIPRTHNSGGIRIWPGMDNDDTPGGAAVTLAATTYSNPVRGGVDAGTGSAHLIWVGAGGSLVGTFTLQCSIVPDPELATDADWVAVTPLLSGTALAVSSNDGNTMISVPVGYIPEWFRVKFAYTSGTGTIRAFARVDNYR